MFYYSLTYQQVSLPLIMTFATTDHDFCLSPFDTAFGIRSTALSWLHSHLSERKQLWSGLDTGSPTTRRQFGVPQGSVLVPALFSLYTTLLSDLAEKNLVNREMFADDTQFNSASQLHQHISTVSLSVAQITP